MAVGLVDGLDRTEIRPDTQAPEIQAPVRRADTKRRWGGLLPPRRDAELERLRQLEGAQAVLERARRLIAQGWVQDAFYVVRVRTRLPSFDDKMPLLPGMTAEVDILTGHKSVLSYLLKPVLKVKSYALRER